MEQRIAARRKTIYYNKRTQIIDRLKVVTPAAVPAAVPVAVPAAVPVAALSAVPTAVPAVLQAARVAL